MKKNNKVIIDINTIKYIKKKNFNLMIMIIIIIILANKKQFEKICLSNWMNSAPYTNVSFINVKDTKKK